MMGVVKRGVLKGEELHGASMLRPPPGCEDPEDAHSHPKGAVNGTESGVSPGKVDKTKKVDRRRLEQVLIFL